MELSPLIQCWAYDEATLPQGNGTVPWSNASGQIHAATQAPCPQHWYYVIMEVPTRPP